MTARERIIAIKLIESAERQPEYARQIGVRIQMRKTDSKNKEKKDA